MREAREALKLKKTKICWPGKILKNGWSSSWSDSCPKSRPSCRVWQPKAALAREREQLQRQAEARDFLQGSLEWTQTYFGLNLYMIDHDRIWIEYGHIFFQKTLNIPKRVFFGVYHTIYFPVAFSLNESRPSRQLASSLSPAWIEALTVEDLQPEQSAPIGQPIDHKQLQADFAFTRWSCGMILDEGKR